MSTAEPPLILIVYTGDPVRISPERITEDMRVPNLGFDRSQLADDLPGASAVTLFRLAESEGALVVPYGLVVDSYSRDNHDTHDFILIASPGGQRAGVTHGWCDVAMIAREAGDERADNNPAVVREALEVMAAKIDAALGGM
jgi:hypothetical protein